MDRRAFLAAAGAAATWAGITVTLSSCSENGNPVGDGGDTPGDGDVAGSISGNHGHSVKITAAQLEAGGAVTLTLSGPHTHQVSLTADQVGQIASGQTVMATSTNDDGHTHGVTFAP